jgi:hypothetical protein
MNFGLLGIQLGLGGTYTTVVWTCQQEGIYDISFSGRIDIIDAKGSKGTINLAIDNIEHVSESVPTVFGLSRVITATANRVLLLQRQLVIPFIDTYAGLVVSFPSVTFKLVNCVFSIKRVQ